MLLGAQDFGAVNPCVNSVNHTVFETRRGWTFRVPQPPWAPTEHGDKMAGDDSPADRHVLRVVAKIMPPLRPNSGAGILHVRLRSYH
jgi:hypothetical protein